MALEFLPDHDEGQFDDAPEDVAIPQTPATIATAADPRGDASYIDDSPRLLEWSEPETEDEDEDEFMEEDFEDNRVEDEDWDVTERGA